ncbi:hypothetical protein ETAA8_52260 [Anatilimnocola aggregata]|uniref:Uncharacterized protein n=1 Tax=Anatilimnocola aggregata TaxID=2528021 RepID=A0A517YIQ0_9BACT|nr:hypothetical protein [Anatilimnocola aggregata]QDU30107.1 hypothetical protein ETAA8_52260 [Anatilimnocola aggregata]
MFGSPDWFKPKTIGWGLTPVRWQGWAYTLAWISVIAAPFVLLLMRDQTMESFAWLAVTMGALFYDVRDILRQKKVGAAGSETMLTATAIGPDKDVLYIGDNEPGVSQHATRNYALHLKKA